MADDREVRHVRAMFLSDVHLGMKPIRCAQLIEFLRAHEAETIYLVGDIVDGWRLAKAWHWPPEYHQLVDILLQKAAAGTRMVYIPSGRQTHGSTGQHPAGAPTVPTFLLMDPVPGLRTTAQLW